MSTETFVFAAPARNTAFSPVSATIEQIGRFGFEATVQAIVDGVLQERKKSAATRFLAICGAMNMHVPELGIVAFAPPSMAHGVVTSPGEVSYMDKGVRRVCEHHAWTITDTMAGALNAAVMQLRAENPKPDVALPVAFRRAA